MATKPSTTNPQIKGPTIKGPTLAHTSIVNTTASSLVLKDKNNQEEILKLASLEETVIKEDPDLNLNDLVREGIIKKERIAKTKTWEIIMGAFLGWGFYFCLIYVVIAFWFPHQMKAYLLIAVSVLCIILLGVSFVVIRDTKSLSLIVSWLIQVVSLTVIIIIGFGLPAATIYYFGHGKLLLEGGIPSLELYGRLIQLSFIVITSLLPVLMFYLFDRYQLGTMLKRLYISLFRLDPDVNTINEIRAKYGSQIKEAYGSDSRGRGRLSPDSRWPLLVCAYVITVGWIVTLSPVGQEFSPQNVEETLKALLPQKTALAFGFLGAYFYSLILISRGYARGDLKPKIYSQIVVRIIITAIVSWVLDAMMFNERFDESGEEISKQTVIMLVLAFSFGFAPDEFLIWLKEKFRGLIPGTMFPRTKLPLEDLEGIDLYDRGRLENEGIVNIEGLAHHELFDLIIETRIPVPRLIDWVDQAILYLHLVGGSNNAGKPRAKLRDYGIRSATDLIITWQYAERRGGKDFEDFKKILGGKPTLYNLEVIYNALSDDEWMETVDCWRKAVPRAPIVRTV